MKFESLLILTAIFYHSCYGQVGVTDQSFREAKDVKVSSFVPARVVFANDSTVTTNISIASNANYRAGNINHVVYLDSIPTDSTAELKTKNLRKFTAGQGIKYIEFGDTKAVFQKVGILFFLTRVLYEDGYSRLTCLFHHDMTRLTLATQLKREHNTYIQFKKEASFTEQLDLIAIFSPSFAPRRSEKAFVKYFNDYPELVSATKAKTFLFDAPAVLQLLKDYKGLKDR